MSYNEYIGQSASKLTGPAVLIGSKCTATHNFVILLGEGLESSDDFELVMGSAAAPMRRKISLLEFDFIRGIVLRQDIGTSGMGS